MRVECRVNEEEVQIFTMFDDSKRETARSDKMEVTCREEEGHEKQDSTVSGAQVSMESQWLL